ncbi:MAG: hypothetical protein AAB075_07460, partial [Gemmatimonadota bacterium]
MDGQSRQRESTDALTGNKTTFTYDASNRVESSQPSRTVEGVTTALSSAIYEVGVDSQSRQRESTDALTGNVTTFAYDPNNNQPVTSQTANAQGVALSAAAYETGIDGQARQRQTTDSLTGNVTTFTYDSTNHLISASTTTAQGIQLSTQSYVTNVDGSDRLDVTIDALTGNRTTYTYDANGQINNATTLNNQNVTLSTQTFEIGADGRSRALTQTDALTNNVTTFTYDANNQITASQTKNGTKLLSSAVYEIGMDGQSRQSESTDALTGNKTTFTYDANNRVQTSQTTRTADGVTTILSSAVYEVGMDGQSRQSASTDALTGNVTTFAYDPNNNQPVTSQTANAQGVALSAAAYE